MDNVDNKIQEATAEPAAAEKEKAAPVLGKFASVDALLDAYSKLEAEFTRRSQRLKELEDGNKAQSAAPSLGNGELLNAVLENEEVKNAVIKDYIEKLTAGKSLPLISGGVSSPAPKNAPKTVKEAGALVKNFLK